MVKDSMKMTLLHVFGKQKEIKAACQCVSLDKDIILIVIFVSTIFGSRFTDSKKAGSIFLQEQRNIYIRGLVYLCILKKKTNKDRLFHLI